MKKIYSLIILVSLFQTFSMAQDLTIDIPENHFGIDDDNSIIVSRIENIENYDNLQTYNNLKINFGGNSFYFNTIPNNLQYSESYNVNNTDNSKQYTLYFTKLPIISITADEEIPDEPKILANFTYSDDLQTLTSLVGIELRGGSSLSYPKKNYDLEFWTDNTGNETHNVQFGNLRSDDDWILNGLYNEPLRLRSYTANKLWLKLYTPSYIEDEPEAKSGVDVLFAEIFLNNHYNGIYNLSEQVDKKQLKLKSFKNDKIRGELYKGISWGATTFTQLPPYNNNLRTWGGYLYKYPKENQITDWSNLYQFTDFVINSSDENFSDSIWIKYDKENFAAYFLFLNLIRATDNKGKNIYLGKYKKDAKYFYVPWDLDGCFGTNWEGINENIYNDIQSNGLINRVIDISPDNALTDIAQMWFNNRNTIFHYDTLTNSISNQYNFLSTNKIYERESVVYDNYTFSQEDLTYTLEWIRNRLDFLDNYFNSILGIDEKEQSDNNNFAFIYPNPTQDRLCIKNMNLQKVQQYKIYNLSGQLIQQGNTKFNCIKIPLLPKGVYIIELDNKKFKFNVK